MRQKKKAAKRENIGNQWRRNDVISEWQQQAIKRRVANSAYHQAIINAHLCAPRA